MGSDYGKFIPIVILANLEADKRIEEEKEK